MGEATTWDPRTRGRSDIEIEADVLVGMLADADARALGCAHLRWSDFAAARHRAIFSAIAAAPTGTIDDVALGRLVGLRPSEILSWRLAASPMTPKADVALLVERR